jgi:hypothetical protein
VDLDPHISDGTVRQSNPAPRTHGGTEAGHSTQFRKVAVIAEY